MNKQVEVYPYNELPLSNKKEWTVDTLNMDKSQKTYVDWKKPNRNIKFYTILHNILKNAN